MNRTLRRPMFRMGGSTGEGITSGLQAPRQGYQDPAGSVKENDLSKVDLRTMDMQQLKDLAGQMSYQPRGTNFNDFLINFGLDLVSRPKSGNIFSQVAASAKDPYAQFTKGKQSAAEQRYASEADMFKTLIAAKADMAGGEGGKSYAALEIAAEMKNVLNQQFKLEDELETLNPNISEDAARIKEIKREQQVNINLINNYQKENPGAKAILQSPKFVKGYVSTIMERLKLKTNEDGSLKYPLGDNSPGLYEEAFKEFLQFLGQGVKDGGRIGYADGEMVQPNMMQGSMPMDQGTQEVPPELTNMDYETLRARLPQEVTDDIVKLISDSEEAFEEFATIETQQDVINFNNKYNVDLVLPAEA